MKIITNIKTAIEQLKDTVLSQNVIKDILFQCFIIEAQFPKEIENKIILLNQNEYYDTNNITSEYEEDIDNYHKTTYILSDYGEGLIIYQQTTHKEVKNITNERLLTLLYNALTYIETDCLINQSINDIAEEIGLTQSEIKKIFASCDNNKNTNNNIAERRKNI